MNAISTLVRNAFSGVRKFVLFLVAQYRRSPTIRRFITVVVWVCVAIEVSFHLSNSDNSLLAAGTAISVSVLGLSLLTGHSGQVSVGNSGFVMIGGYSAALWATHHAPKSVFGGSAGLGMWTIAVALGLATVIGALSGVVIGVPGTRLRGPYLAGFTLAFAVVLPNYISTLSFVGGTGGLFVSPMIPPEWFTNLFHGPYASLNANAQWPADLILVISGAAYFFMANLFRSKTGRSFRLVRDNDVAAELVGVNLPRTRTTAFIVSAAYGGLCGGMMVLATNSVNPNSTFPFTLSITILTVMVLGGIGTLTGAVIAGVIFAFSGILVSHLNSLTGIDPTSNLGINMQGILFGAILILTMLLAPSGIAGLGIRVRQKFRRT